MRRLAFLLIGLALAGLVAGWWFWPRAERQIGAVQNSPSVLKGPATANVTTTPALLTLEIDNTSGAKIRVGEPLRLSVALTGTSSTQAFRIGKAGRAWSGDLRFETRDGPSSDLKFEQLGAPAVHRRARAPREPALASSEPDGVAVVDDSRVYVVEFALSPDESARLAPGTYAVRVVLPLTPAPEGVTMLTSNAVSVTVEPAASGEQAVVAQEKRRLEAAARFYLQAHQWEEARRIALQLVERQDAGTNAFVLLGDSLNGLRRDDEALAAYQDALATLPQKMQEPPAYLLARVHQVRERLEGRAAKD